MKRKIVIILAMLGLLISAILGIGFYRKNNIFIWGHTYPLDSQELDFREEELSFEQYNELHNQLPNCKILWNVPFQNGKYSSDSESLSITTLTKSDIAVLMEYFPHLQKVDASACQDYTMLESLKKQMPELYVQYMVSLGEKSFSLDSTKLILENGDYDFSTMITNLRYLPEISSIQLKNSELDMEQINNLKDTYPEIMVTYTVEILGKEYDESTTELDLSAMISEEVPEVCKKLPMLPCLSTVELSEQDDISHISKEDVQVLMSTIPQAVFHYSFDFYGEIISTTAEEVYIKNKRIGDEGEDEVRLALDLMQNCRRFVLDSCQVSNEVMSKIREDYKEKTKIVWRVSFGGGSALTDVEVIRSTYDLVDDNSKDLIYCEDVRFIDLGHNEYLDAIPFVAGMPNLEFAIISGAPIKDLTPFENCKKLRILEIAYCSYIDDVSPLASCKDLEMLNISFTHVTDLTPLDNIGLTHLCAVSPSARIPIEEQQRFNNLHPDCWAQYVGDQPYGPGWRYARDNKPLEWYESVCDIFGYPHALNNAGWYLEKN